LIDNIITRASSCLQDSMHHSESISKQNALLDVLPLMLFEDIFTAQYIF